MPDPQLHTLSGEDYLTCHKAAVFLRQRLWFVYAWRRNGQTLFVGRSRNPLEGLRKILNIKEPVEPSDEINIFGFPDLQDAYALHLGILINQSPVYNDLPSVHKKKAKLQPLEREILRRKRHANSKLPGGDSGTTPVVP